MLQNFLCSSFCRSDYYIQAAEVLLCTLLKLYSIRTVNLIAVYLKASVSDCTCLVTSKPSNTIVLYVEQLLKQPSLPSLRITAHLHQSQTKCCTPDNGRVKCCFSISMALLLHSVVKTAISKAAPQNCFCLILR